MTFTSNINQIKEYSNISNFLDWDENYGLHFKYNENSQFNLEITSNQSLQYYYHDNSTKKIIEHNLQWAMGNRNKPKFQFIYLLLPTLCNQRCVGCFTGQDTKNIPKHLKGSFLKKEELDNILNFAVNHSVNAIVYGGSGELFTWNGAIELIRNINSHGLKFVVFTNGVLITKRQLRILNDLKTNIIISIRDTNEINHNKLVGKNNFTRVLKTIDYALELGFNYDNRLAVEIPATNENEGRILGDLLPSLRKLKIVPMIEEYLQYNIKDRDKCSAHNFTESRQFFKKLYQKDRNLGNIWKPELGTRILGQPKCQRPLYSFTIFPNRDISDCPAGFKTYGNMNKQLIENIIYSDKFKKDIIRFNFCACSVFYSRKDSDIPENLKNAFF